MTKAERCEASSSGEERLVHHLEEAPTLLDDAALERVSGGLIQGSGAECHNALPAA